MFKSALSKWWNLQHFGKDNNSRYAAQVISIDATYKHRKVCESVDGKLLHVNMNYMWCCIAALHLILSVYAGPLVTLKHGGQLEGKSITYDGKSADIYLGK